MRTHLLVRARAARGMFRRLLRLLVSWYVRDLMSVLSEGTGDTPTTFTRRGFIIDGQEFETDSWEITQHFVNSYTNSYIRLIGAVMQKKQIDLYENRAFFGVSS